MLASGNVPAQYALLADGFRGTDQTVEIMRRLTTGAWGMRSPKIRALAINILREYRVPEKAYAAEADAIFRWVRDNIRYTKDVTAQETLCPPEEIAFNSRAGDCDDKAMLTAALLGSIGTQTRFKVMGVTPFQYSHVYLEALVNGHWIPMDPIMADNVTTGMRAKPMGWEAPKSMRKIEKTFADNLPEDTPMGRNINGMGYIADSRIVSFLEPDPVNEAPVGPYVQMDSMLDTDLPIEQISNNMPVFAQNAHFPTGRVGAPVLRQMRPRMLDQRLPPALVAARFQHDEAVARAAEFAAANPMNGLHDVMTPDQLAGMGAQVQDERPRANMQRPALAQSPEGIDVMFGRSALVVNGSKGDRIIYRGLTALNERPPIRPAPGVGAYVDSPAYQGSNGLRGLLAGRNLSGPGLADLADGSVGPAPVSAPAPAPSTPWIQYGVAAALVFLGYKMLRR